jgi:hypothetical protein
MQRLQTERVGALGRDKLHRRALHRLCDRFGVAIVVLFTFAIRPHVFRRHQSGIMAERLKLATEMMRADTGLHANQALRQVGQPRFHLAARPLLFPPTFIDRGTVMTTKMRATHLHLGRIMLLELPLKGLNSRDFYRFEVYQKRLPSFRDLLHLDLGG